ncbi:MAG: transglutaminase domain-containing protein [Myxococcota bacterium]|nr:transglutaminase domain-containing protein [Myxococcota bacterium]
MGSGVPLVDGPVGRLPVDRSPISRDALDAYLSVFEESLQSLLAPLELGPEGSRRASCNATGPGTFALDVTGAPRPRRWTVTNRSQQAARGVRFQLGGRDWSTREAMARSACGEASDDRARAFAIYRFVRDHRVHGPPPSDHRDDPIASDPVSFFHSFGYGLCGNAANVFAVLCETVGIPCRVWNIQGHTFPEVCFDGDWHVLDPDMRVFYPERGVPGSALSMEDLVRHGAALLKRLQVDPVFEPQRETLGRALSDRDRHRLVATGASLTEALGPSKTVAYDLLPGEALEFAYASRGPWFGCRRVLHVPQSPPSRMAHVRSRVDLRPGAVQRALGATGFSSEGDAVRADAGARLVVPLSLPHPIVDAWIEASPNGERLEVTVERSDGSVVPVVRTGATPERVGLRAALRGTEPSSGSRLVVSLAESALFEHLTLVLVGQVGATSLPRVAAGNPSLRVDGEFESLQFELGYDESRDDLAPPPLLEPAVDAVLEETFCFRWSGADDAEYDLEVSAEEDFAVAVSPNFERRVRGASWRPTDDDLALLPAGRRYLWRVRAAVGLGQAEAAWSAPSSFAVGMASTYVRRVGERLRAGATHHTLGTSIRDAEWFEDSAKATLAFLREQGLEPGSRVVDYGCGSLRLGASLIPFLEPEGYWGVDVTDEFFKAGLALLPQELIEEKKPRLSVLTPEVRAQGDAFGADVLVSFGVLMHVPEVDLPGFFGSVAEVMAPGCVGYVQFKEAPELVQTGEMSWSHPAGLLREHARAAGLEADVQSHPSLDPYYSFEDGRSQLLRLRKR